MEDWSSAEANLFEEAIEKYGKDFNGIKKDFLGTDFYSTDVAFKTTECAI